MINEQTFLERHDNEQFRHCLELCHAIRCKDAKLRCEPSKTDAKNFLRIYEGRAGHLERYDTEHAIHLKADVKDLCSGLKNTNCKTCLMWSFEMQHGRGYLVVEDVETKRVLGCLKTISKLGVTEEEWEKLWNKK